MSTKTNLKKDLERLQNAAQDMPDNSFAKVTLKRFRKYWKKLEKFQTGEKKAKENSDEVNLDMR